MREKKFNRSDLVKITNFCYVKDTFKRIKKPQIRRKYLQNTCLIKDFYPKHTKNFRNSTVVKQSTQKLGQKKKKKHEKSYMRIYHDIHIYTRVK